MRRLVVDESDLEEEEPNSETNKNMDQEDRLEEQMAKKAFGLKRAKNKGENESIYGNLTPKKKRFSYFLYKSKDKLKTLSL